MSIGLKRTQEHIFLPISYHVPLGAPWNHNTIKGERLRQSIMTINDLIYFLLLEETQYLSQSHSLKSYTWNFWFWRWTLFALTTLDVTLPCRLWLVKTWRFYGVEICCSTYCVKFDEDAALHLNCWTWT